MAADARRGRAIKFWHAIKNLGKDTFEDKAARQFIFEFQTTAAKLAGALDSIAEDRVTPDPAFTVAYLKRALDHLHKSQTGLETVATMQRLPVGMIAEARQELFELREGILKLMDEFRGRG